MKNMGIIGCGDFLRWQANDILNSKLIKVKAVYDPMLERAQKYANIFKSEIASSSDQIFDDAEIDIV